MTTILGIKLEERYSTAPQFQKILTDFGCVIKTRLGLHSQEADCVPYGIILLELKDDIMLKDMESELCKIENIEIQKMKFN